MCLPRLGGTVATRMRWWYWWGCGGGKQGIPAGSRSSISDGDSEVASTNQRSVTTCGCCQQRWWWPVGIGDRAQTLLPVLAVWGGGGVAAAVVVSVARG